MPKLSWMLLTTDFDSLKNDAEGIGTIVIPGGDVLAAGETKTYETTVAVGEPESILIVSYTGNVSFPGGDYEALAVTTRHDREGIVGGSGGFAYSILLRFAHSGGNNVRLVASILNSYGTPLTLSSTTDSFTFRIRSIKVPRFS